MNPAQLDQFNHVFDDHYLTTVADVAATDPTHAVRRTRAGFACAYRFWAKIEDDHDPAGWIHEVIDQRGHTVTPPQRESDHLENPNLTRSVDLRAEHKRVVRLARRQGAVADVVIWASALLIVAARLHFRHR